ncbi:MAG: hypothetical protein WCV88_06150 [Patescibacteria group bacterium]|jgi:intein-encoded DNA endonuclease-like protein
MADVGRPTVMTAEIVAKLEDAFLRGLNDSEACFYANISRSAFYDYIQLNPEFNDRKEQLKEAVKTRAKLNIEQGISAGDKPLSQWYLERRDKDFKSKSEVSAEVSVSSLKDEEKAKLNELL